MIKADAKVVFDKGKPEKFTNFELLEKKVEVLEDTLDKLVDILRGNGITKKEEIVAEYFDDDRVFRELEGK